jgi:hypothetical protein
VRIIYACISASAKIGAVVLLMICMAAGGWAGTVLFTGTGVGDITRVPNGYDGLNWVNMLTVNAANQPSYSGYGKLAVSQANASMTFIPEGLTGSFGGTGAFLLDSINLDAGWNDGVGVEVAGWLGGTLMYSSFAVLNVSGSPITLTPGWGGAVDEVTIVATSHGTETLSNISRAAHIAVGDITLSALALSDPAPTQNPEPATYIGISTGLAIFVWQARRSKRVV